MWAMNINTDTSCSRTMNPGMVLACNMVPDITMSPGASAGHLYQYVPWAAAWYVKMASGCRLDHKLQLSVVIWAQDINMISWLQLDHRPSRALSSSMDLDITMVLDDSISNRLLTFTCTIPRFQ